LPAGFGSATTNKGGLALSVRGLIGVFSIIVVALWPGNAAGQGKAGGFYGELRGGTAFLSESDLDDSDGLDAELRFETGWLKASLATCMTAALGVRLRSVIARTIPMICASAATFFSCPARNLS